MRFPLAMALVSLTTAVAASDYKFDMFYPSANCTTEAEPISGDGDRGCSGYFKHGAASAWKLSNIKDGCVVNFYSDKSCRDKLDWIDGKSPKGQCKQMPSYSAARTFDVSCP
ncbi:hypothetical protein F4820DRAFT_418298 [Hypoxylon rubiginosum]|uniref:Uncharacterized protein n=1 Tax=Hypoxylon rubiginosum TaxID=110542 RepID=A0ACB9Z2X3_9PEZI|nr:hypothetical protein F4820DRAFT_418298 [Hypoxylon rubiginosum]